MLVNVTTSMYLIQGLTPCVLCAAFLLVLVLTDNSFSHAIYNSFVSATVSGILLSLFEGIDYYVQGNNGNVTLSLVLAACSFTCRVACIGFTATITLRNEKIHKIVIYLLILINGIVSFISVPTGIVFRCSPEHVWSYGLGIIVPYAITFLFVLILLISGIHKYYANKMEAITVIMIILICIPANILEFGPKLKLLLSSSLLISVSFYFLCLNVELYKRDAMTELFNRRSFYLDAKRNEKKRQVLISLDMNCLKELNDNYGHAEGDKAIRSISQVMLRAFDRRGKVYRVGGDEFMIAVTRDRFLSKIPELLERFDLLLSKTPYVVSYGYAEYNPGDNFDEIVQKADEAMYVMKRRIKGDNVR